MLVATVIKETKGKKIIRFRVFLVPLFPVSLCTSYLMLKGEIRGIKGEIRGIKGGKKNPPNSKGHLQ